MWPFEYPYTNFHELNLDWIISRLKAIENYHPINQEENKSYIIQINLHSPAYKIRSAYQ